MLGGRGYCKSRNVFANSDKFSGIRKWKPVKHPEADSQTELQVLELGITICRHENCALLGYYVARSGNFLPTFQDNPSSASEP